MCDLSRLWQEREKSFYSQDSQVARAVKANENGVFCVAEVTIEKDKQWLPPCFIAYSGRHTNQRELIVQHHIIRQNGFSPQSFCGRAGEAFAKAAFQTT